MVRKHWSPDGGIVLFFGFLVNFSRFLGFLAPGALGDLKGNIRGY